MQADSTPEVPPQSSRSSTIIQIVAVTLISLALIPVALEIGLRLLPQAIPLDACTTSVVLGQYCQWWYAYDKPLELGYTYRSGYHHEGPFNPADPAVIGAQDETCAPPRDESFTLTLNADQHGLLNPMPLADRYDIVMSGDSFSQPFSPDFWYVDLAAYTGMSTYNLGMDGWGPLSETAAIRKYGLQTNPKWVILMYFEGNDQFNVEEYQRRKDSGLSWLEYNLKDVHGLDRLILPHMLAYWMGQTRKSQSPTDKECVYPMTVYTEVNTFETIFFDVHIRALSVTRDEMEQSREWSETTEAILDLKQRVESQGGRFLLVYIPTKEHLAWGRLWESVEVNNFLARTQPPRTFVEMNQHVSDQMHLMEDFAGRNHIELLNLYYPYRKVTLRGQDLYNFADVHWNVPGNQLAARLIADYILGHHPQSHYKHP